jgi:DNA-binding CsgD family transcriptional regulator
MRQDERHTQFIDEIYDAALDPALWPAVLGKIARFVGGQSAGLMSRDAANRAGDVHYHYGCSPRYLALYSETYWKFDPLAQLPFFRVGEAVSFNDYMPEAEFRDGRFYREWLQPQGMLDAVNVVHQKSGTSSAVLSVIRHEASGPVDVEMRRRILYLMPHVRRAVLVGKAIDRREAEASTFADTLDGLSAGMLLVDAEGRIVHANTAGHAMLAAGDCLEAVGGRLVGHGQGVDQALRAAFAAAAGGSAAAGIGGIAVPLHTADGERHLAHVLPLTSGARRRAGDTYAAVAALFVHKAAVDGPSPPEAIARHFKLTPAELRVLLAIVEVGGGPEAAEALGIAPSTVKTHLSRLYQKTGAGRQADLVKLVAAFSSPLRG